MAAPAPTRSFMDDPSISWRSGSRPDYSVVDQSYMAGRSMNHPAGSLERQVEDLFKTWEMESVHKANLEDRRSIDPSNYYVQVNGGRKVTLNDKGVPYQIFLEDCPLFDMSAVSGTEVDEAFRNAFSSGFPWEVVQVHSGPPRISFTWRHWAKWSGPFLDHQPTGETMEIYGMAVARVNKDMQIQNVELYFDPNPMMANMTEFSKRCPFSGNTKSCL